MMSTQPASREVLFRIGPLNITWALLIGLYLVIVTMGLVGMIYGQWPADPPPTLSLEVNAQGGPDSSLVVIATAGLDTLAASADTLRLDASLITPLGAGLDTTVVATKPPDDPVPGHRKVLLLVLMIGALGASLHGLTSLAEYVGNKTFTRSWVLWYFLRPFVGGILALLFYFVIRGGLFPEGEAITSNGLYGIVALAGLIGLFSKQALYKLSELFDVLFRTNKDEKLKDSLHKKTAGTIDTLVPDSVPVGSTDVKITVTGSDFVEKSEVHVGGEKRSTTFVSGTKLEAKLEKADLQKAGELAVTVFNPGPEGGTSDAATFTVTEADKPNGDAPPDTAPPPDDETT